MKQTKFNGWRRLFAVSLVPMVLLAMFTFSLASPGLAHASGGGGGVVSCTGCSIDIASSGQLLARTTLQISATVTCTLPAGSTFVNGFGNVEISQASGQQVSQGFGEITLTTCDGTAQTVQVDVTPSQAPFHGGPAVASGFLFVDYIDPFGNFVQASASSAPQVIRITA